MTFIEQRFPEEVSYSMSGGPVFNTTIQESHVGREQRNVNWSRARHVWKADASLQSTAAYDEIRAFFFNTEGRYSGFRFKDWLDFSMTAGNIATGDGTTTTFKVYKKYAAGSVVYSRWLTKLVSGTVLVYVDGVLKTAGADYTLYPNSGYIVFAVAPANTKAITVTCEFDVPARLDTDSFEAMFSGYDAQEWRSLDVIEISLEIENAITGPV